MVPVDPSQQSAARCLPLPDFHDLARRRREVQSALRQPARPVGDRARPATACMITGDDDRLVRDQHGEFVFKERAFVSVMQDVPTVLALDERQMFERTGGIFPGEAEVDPFAVMHRPNLGRRMARAAEIPAEPVSTVTGLADRQAGSGASPSSTGASAASMRLI